MSLLQCNLQGFVKACFMQAGRSMAHKAAKLITLCTEYSKKVDHLCRVPPFSLCLLQVRKRTASCRPFLKAD